MAASRESQVRAESRRSKVAALLCQGVTSQYEIALRLGLAEKGDEKKIECERRKIGYDIEIIRAEWLSTRAAVADVWVAASLAKVDALERAAWEGWERSCRDRTGERKHGNTDKSKGFVETRVERRDGNPKFLDSVKGCVRLRLEILGLLKTENAGAETVVTVVNSIDLQAVIGDKPGLMRGATAGPILLIDHADETTG